MSQIYLVTCNAPTPLRKNPYQCIADDEKDAVVRFKNFNGIADTDHAINVELIMEPAPAVEPEKLKTQETKSEETDEQPQEVAPVVSDATPAIEPEKPKTEADHIREYLTANPSASNKDVISALKEKGIDVTSSQVSAVRK